MCSPVTAFCKNMSLRQIIETNIIDTTKNFLRLRKMRLKENAFHIIHHDVLRANKSHNKSTITKEKFNICHKVSCKSNYVIYLLECLICRIQ